MALISAQGVLLKFEYSEMTQTQNERNQHRVRNFAILVFAVVQTRKESYINLKYLQKMMVVKPHLDCVALGRLGLEGVLLVGDVVVALVLAGEGVGLAVAEVGLVRLVDAGPGASCSGLKF